MMAVQQRVAVITNGDGELGSVLARALSREGMVVFVFRPTGQGIGIRQMIGSNCFRMRCDITREKDVRRAFAALWRRLGRLDVVVNNSGGEGPTCRAERISLRDWERTIRVNLNSAFLCVREAIPLLRKSGGGTILQLGSIGYRMAYTLRLPYAVSMAALEALTRCLAAELGTYNIRVNLVAPGPIEGPHVREVMKTRARKMGQSERTVLRRYLRASALGRLVTAEDVAKCVLFLCSPTGANISGQTLEVSAGWTAATF